MAEEYPGDDDTIIRTQPAELTISSSAKQTAEALTRFVEHLTHLQRHLNSQTGHQKIEVSISIDSEHKKCKSKFHIHTFCNGGGDG